MQTHTLLSDCVCVCVCVVVDTEATGTMQLRQFIQKHQNTECK